VSKSVKTEIAIIGSGLGGVLCGALLGREGYRIIVLEKMGIPGGRYTTIDKDGFKVNTGAWAIGLHGERGPVYRLVHDLGGRVETKVPEPDHARLWFQDKDMPLPKKGQLRTIIDTVAKNERESERVMGATRRALRWQEPSDNITCAQWLYQYTDNPLIHGQFDFFSRLMTATYHYDFPAGEYFRLLRNFGRLGDLTAMPKNGQKATMDELVKLLKSRRVDIRYNTVTTKILSANTQVKGVLAKTEENGEIEIVSDVVISDVGPKETVRLAGESNFDTAYLNEVSRVNETKAVVIVWGYDKPILDYQAHIQLIEYDRLGSAWEPHHIWPEYVPKGRYSLYTYSTMKTNNTEKELEMITAQCKEAFPALGNAEIVATLVFKSEWPILRAHPSRCLGIKSPIQGLYIAGDAVNPSGWTCGEGIAISSQAIAEDIKSRFPHS